MITLEDVVRSTNDRMLSVLTSWQQGAIEAHHAWMQAMAPLVPELNPYHEMPTALQDALGDPEKIMDHNYRFAVAVVDLQRDYIQQLFHSSSVAPRTPHVPPLR